MEEIALEPLDLLEGQVLELQARITEARIAPAFLRIDDVAPDEGGLVFDDEDRFERLGQGEGRVGDDPRPFEADVDGLGDLEAAVLPEEEGRRDVVAFVFPLLPGEAACRGRGRRFLFSGNLFPDE